MFTTVFTVPLPGVHKITTDLEQLLFRLGLSDLALHLPGLGVEGLEALEGEQRRGRHPRSLDRLAEELHVVLSGETAPLHSHPRRQELCACVFIS